MATKSTKKIANRLSALGGVIVVLSGLMFLGSLLNVYGDISSTDCTKTLDHCVSTATFDRNILISRATFFIGVAVALVGVGIMMYHDLGSKKK